MTTLLGLSGSLRSASYNTALLRGAQRVAPEGVTLELASIADIPIYDGDAEARDGLPAPVTALKERIVAADGLILATPEYNGSLPGAFKNAIDWLSRPPKDIARVFGGRPVGLMGATPGRGGTRLAQAAWLPVLRALGARPWFEQSLYVGGAAEVFDDEGNLVDDAIEKLLTRYMSGFSAFVAG